MHTDNTTPRREARAFIDTTRPVGRIDDDVYGHFLESAFFGNIEGGVFDEGSPRSVSEPGLLNGVRRDVLDLVRDLAPGPIRWPGGNFTSGYRWEEGVGPRDDRPTRLDLAWGDTESNRFGTDEFLAWAEAVGAEPYLVHSCRDVDEAVRWVEYTNSRHDTTLTRNRRTNGRDEPWKVRYWGIGNEVYGPWQMGHRSADEYALAAREHARFMRLVDSDLKLIGVGIPWDQEHWTRAALEQAGKYFDYLSLHLYGATTELWAGDDYENIVAQSLYFEQGMNTYSHLITSLSDEIGLPKPPQITLDEWTMRHLEPAAWDEPQRGDDGGVAPRDTPEVDGWPNALRVNRYAPRTVGDALFSAGVLHAIHRTAGHDTAVTMANPVNLVNANGIIVARPEGAFGSALYHVWHLYGRQLGRTVLHAEVDGPSRSASVPLGDNRVPSGGLQTASMTVPFIDVSATRAEDGTVRIAVINRHRDEAIRFRPVFDGRTDRTPPAARIHRIGADIAVTDSNSLSAPDVIGTRDLGQVDAVDGVWLMPPHSVTVLTMDLHGR
ncbi:alpha-L-arabinofuranosidase C-terminal domain-containing protein [Microbacterium murale]|uniref:non-reducing end alpha-L-arabinofuranosidase n=1 Tax=Microbacterium murale TaxID=1081040 RepID=A0ABU0P990_9MICO|nr:alpha-L-arabinofuranosidase C-terminal domain-containing protein [Microbacterium murale]MDQ0643512.1 alpha-N-arabinofuranosidase [Microbacterium murale]